MPDQNRPEFLRATELTRDELKRKRSPLTSIVILILVVIGASAGGYFLHKKFRSNNQAPATPLTEADLPANPEIVSRAPSSRTAAYTEPTRPAVAPAPLTSPSAPADAPSLLASPASFSSPAATPAVSLAPAAAAPTLATTVPAAAPVASPAPTLPATPVTPATPAIAADSGSEPPAITGQSPAQILSAADKLVAQRSFDQAKRLLQTIQPGNADAHSGALYRLGLVGRYSGDEKLAQESWGKAMQTYPAKPAGRLSALGLADTWYHWYVETTPDFAQWEKIRDAYATVLGTDGARFLDDATDRRIGERLNKLTAKLVFDPATKIKGAETHVVKSGEYIATIAREYGVDSSSIIAINGIDPKRLRAGQELKILSGKMLLVVDKKRFTADFFLDGRFIKRYPCATGAPTTETPAGHYTVFSLVKEPPWTAPDGRIYKYGEPGHLIGPRWMALKGMGTNGLGVHGTVDPNSMGKKISNGCVRLLNNDVIELYGFASIQPGREAEVLIIE